MLTKEGNVKVADFGLAKLTGGHITDDLSRLTMTNVAMGMYVYMVLVETPGEVTTISDREEHFALILTLSSDKLLKKFIKDTNK